jgi:hypothetical protein
MRRMNVPYLIIALSGLVLAACAGNTGEARPAEANSAKPVEPAKKLETYMRNGFACCNLHYEGDSISDSSLSQQPFIALGTPIKVKTIDGYHADVEVDGKPMRLGLDFGRTQETTEQWVNKLVVLENPKLKMTRFAPTTRKAIEAGKLLRGMSKEQVIMAIGYPQANENPDLNAPSWRYWWSSFGPYYVHWAKGSVSKIDGHSETVSHMIYKGK